MSPRSKAIAIVLEARSRVFAKMRQAGDNGGWLHDGDYGEAWARLTRVIQYLQRAEDIA